MTPFIVEVHFQTVSGNAGSRRFNVKANDREEAITKANAKVKKLKNYLSIVGGDVMEYNAPIIVSHLTAVMKLKEKFTGNNPVSWRKLSKRELSEMYAEHIVGDRTANVKIQ